VACSPVFSLSLLKDQIMLTYRTFPTLADARAYRHEYGTGGWIFEPTLPAGADPDFYPMHGCILFPPEFTPSGIFKHPFTVGRSGNLISN
jgi:hypothetical protein